MVTRQIDPHAFLRGDYYSEDCRICQLPRRNTRMHPAPDLLPVVTDRTEPAHRADVLALPVAA